MPRSKKGIIKCLIAIVALDLLLLQATGGFDTYSRIIRAVRYGFPYTVVIRDADNGRLLGAEDLPNGIKNFFISLIFLWLTYRFLIRWSEQGWRALTNFTIFGFLLLIAVVALCLQIYLSYRPYRRADEFNFHVLREWKWYFIPVQLAFVCAILEILQCKFPAKIALFVKRIFVHVNP